MDEQTGLAGEGKVRRWLAGLAVGAVMVLALLPATGWMVREQVVQAAGALALRPAKVETPIEEVSPHLERIRAIAARHPDDFPLQLAATQRLAFAALKGDGSSKWRDDAYDALTEQFAELPSLHANVLRFSSNNWVHIRRPEAGLVEGRREPPLKNPNPELNRPESIQRFLAHAAEGERLEPDNAYFPAMACIALFAAQRDVEALETLHRAATKTRWREYYRDQCEGDWRLDEALGRRGALVRTGRAAMLLFPQYAQLRSVARLASYLAMKAEQDGDPERGLLIRRDVMRVGSLMRSQGQSLIASLVGIAVVRVAMSRPGGSPSPPGPANEHSEEKDALVADAYQDYLSQLGHGEEAAWVRAEREAASRVRGLLGTGMISEGLEGPLYTTAAYWTGAVMLLLNVAWWGVLGLVAAGLAASRWGHSGQPLPVALKRGLVLGVGLLASMLTIFGMIHASHSAEWVVFLTFAALIGAPILVLQWLYRSQGKQNVRLPLSSAAVTALVIPELLALAIAQGLAAGMRLEFFGPNPQMGQMPTLLWMIGGSLSLPVMAATLFGVAGRVLRVPVGISLVRGFRGAAVPVICVLLLAYGGAVLATTRQEVRLEYHLTRTLENEGRFIAELAGKQWPGPTR